MSDAVTGTWSVVISGLGHGLPTLLLQFVVTLLLLALGIFIYTLVAPMRELEQMRRGNVAAATTLGGTVVALAIPLAVLLATSGALLEIVVWGIVAIIIQLVTFAIASTALHGLRGMIQADNMAAAVFLVSAQLAVALINAAAMVPV